MRKSKYFNSPFKFTLIFILFVVFNIFSCQKKESNDSIRFVFMTDVHIQPELDADDGFKMAIDKIKDLNPDFVITGGDLIMDALDESFERSVEQFDLYKEISDELNVPVYNAIGNHDVFGIYEDSGMDVTHPEYGKKMYKNRIGEGKTYYSFDHDNWHFMILDVVGITDDNKYMGIVDSVQIEWIKKDIQKLKKETPVIVVGHIPFITAAKQLIYGYPAEMTPSLVVTNGLEVLKLFEECNLRLVLQGHLHIVEEIIYKDIHFITGGAISSKWWEGTNHGFEEGFVVIDINKEQFSWDYIDFEWTSTYVDTMAAE